MSATPQFTWSTSKLHDAAGRFGTLATDSNNGVHTAHSAHTGSKYVLSHTADAFGSWVDKIVDSTSVVESVSVAIDSTGRLHIS